MIKRQQVWEKSKGVCWYCGKKLQKGWHVDHFNPLGRNPDKTVTNPKNENIENLVPACPPCNIMKSDMDIEGFRALISNFVKRLNRDIPIFRHAKRYGLVQETGNEVDFWFEQEGCRRQTYEGRS